MKDEEAKKEGPTKTKTDEKDETTKKQKEKLMKTSDKKKTQPMKTSGMRYPFISQYRIIVQLKYVSNGFTHSLTQP